MEIGVRDGDRSARWRSECECEIGVRDGDVSVPHECYNRTPCKYIRVYRMCAELGTAHSGAGAMCMMIMICDS